MKRRRPVASSNKTKKDDGDENAMSRRGAAGEEEPMDEQDQERLIEDIRGQVERQQKQMYRAFRALCQLAALVSALIVILDEFVSSSSWRRRVLRWVHALASGVLHLATAAAVQPISNSGSPPSSTIRAFGGLEVGIMAVIGAVVVANALFVIVTLTATSSSPDQANTTQQQRQASVGMGVANLLTLGVGGMLRWDQRDSGRAIRELEDAQYRHKCL